MHVFGNGFASADIFVDVYTDGNARIRYSGQQGESFRMEGRFNFWENASIFQGSSLY